ncbi:MAG: helix-turn-helix transcriptional regulator [Devosia sp.]
MRNFDGSCDDRHQRAYPQVVAMSLPDISAHDFSSSRRAAAHCHRGCTNPRDLIDGKHAASRPGTKRLIDPFSASGNSGEETFAKRLQQSRTLARPMQHWSRPQGIEHRRVAMTAPVETTGSSGERILPMRQADSLATWHAVTVENLILQQLDSQMLTATLAKACSLSREQFLRLFKQTFGTPPHRWQRERRIETAKKLLRDPHCALADIAMRCGFSDQAHFTSVFKLATRLTPNVWRQRRLRG